MTAKLQPRSVAVYVIFLLMLVRFTNGQVVPYDNLSLFQSQTGSTANGTMPASGSTTSQVVGSMTFTPFAPSLLDFRPNWTPLTPGNDLAINGDEEFNIDFASPITSLGFQWVDVPDPTDTTFTMTFKSGGVVVDTVNFSGPENLLLFNGFVASQPFDRVEILENGDDFQNEFFGQFYTGAVANSWTNGNGNWSDASSWTTGAPPSASEYAVINPTASTAVGAIPPGSAVAGLTVDNLGSGTTLVHTVGSSSLSVANNIYLALEGTSRIAVQNGADFDVGGTVLAGGVSGDATLDVLTGGTLNSGSALIAGGASSTSSANVDGVGSIWTNSGTLEVGSLGDATLNVQNAGTLTTNQTWIGRQNTSVSTVNVSNASLTSTGGLSVGGSLTTSGGTGTLNVQTGATVQVDGPLKVWSGGTVNVDGGLLTANGGFENSAGGTLNLTDGTLAVTGGVFEPSSSTIDGPDASSNPLLELGAGASADFGSLGGPVIGANFRGNLTVRDGASVNAAATTVGQFGTGTLTIQHGGTVTGSSAIVGAESGADGTVLVEGAGSSWNSNSGTIFIGSRGSGILTIQDGGSVTSDRGSIGNQASATGLVTVDGMGSSWTNMGIVFDIGGGGTGELTIQNGGSVTNASNVARIGVSPGSSGIVTVDGAGSSLVNSNDLWIASAGTGTLTIRNDGDVTSGASGIGALSGSNGTVTVDGAGSRWTTSTLDVGGRSGFAGGTGSLHINEALVEVAGALKIWPLGTLTLNGGTLKVNSTLVEFEGTFDYVAGTFHLTDPTGYTVGANTGPIDQALGLADVTRVNGNGLIVDQTLTVPAGTSVTAVNSEVTAGSIINGGLINANNMTLTATSGLQNNADLVLIDTTVEGSVSNAAGSSVTVLGTVDFNGMVSGPGNFYGPGTANFNGGLRPGGSPAQVSFEGNVALGNSNTLAIEIGGTMLGDDYDSLLIAGTASLAGDLELDLIGGFIPTTADTFTILQAMDLTASFANAPTGERVDLQNGAGSLLVSYDNTANAVVLAGYRTTLDCDFDFDGACNGSDIDLLVTEIVSGTDGPTFDLTGDGQVTRADINDATDGWLLLAGEENIGPGQAYLEGDANLDGTVDGVDFLEWNASKFTTSSLWTLGDFDANGVVDGQDFLVWNANKFSASDSVNAVPEPGAMVLLLVALVNCCRTRRVSNWCDFRVVPAGEPTRVRFRI